MEKRAWKVWEEALAAHDEYAALPAADLKRLGRASDMAAVEVIKRALESAARSSK